MGTLRVPCPGTDPHLVLDGKPLAESVHGRYLAVEIGAGVHAGTLTYAATVTAL
jgi:hypothetical protein